MPGFKNLSANNNYKIMKIKNIVAALAISAAVLAGCKKSDPVLAGMIGQWHYGKEC